MKRKVGLIIGYNGEGYHGLQFNGDLNTIEKKVISILLKNECITEINSLDAGKIDLKACSRTDKGVHASFNVLNVKIIQEPTHELFLKLQADFEEEGMILYKMIRLPKSFIGHKAARSRIYKYLLPTYFLEKSDFKTECENLRLNDEFTRMMQNKDCEDESNSNCNNEKPKIYREYSSSDIEPLKGFRSNNIELCRKMLQQYIGTNNYHNFTIKKSSGDVKRFMREITVSEPIIHNDIQYVEVKIHGQSFLLHQIRKMISFVVLNCRYGRAYFEDNFSKALSKEEVHIPNAPSQYLFLNHVFFEDFNKKRTQIGEEAIEVDEAVKEAFERKKIYPSIFTENNIYEWLKYLDSVRFHNDRFEIFKKEQ